MKTKKPKLTLSKATIANLNDLKLAGIRGGLSVIPCHSAVISECPEKCPDTDETAPIIMCEDPITYAPTCWCVTEPPEYSCVTICPFTNCL
jgi:hypothetical protein